MATVLRKPFEPQSDVHQNVRALRAFLGSATRELSLSGLAGLLNKRDGRQRSASTIQRWEEGVEPDYESASLMASMAGVTFEEFCLGSRHPQADVTEPADSQQQPATNDAHTDKQREPLRRIAYPAALREFPRVRSRIEEIETEFEMEDAPTKAVRDFRSTLRDRHKIGRFLGGSVNDRYTEQQMLDAIDNVRFVVRSQHGLVVGERPL